MPLNLAAMVYFRQFKALRMKGFVAPHCLIDGREGCVIRLLHRVDAIAPRGVPDQLQRIVLVERRDVEGIDAMIGRGLMAGRQNET